MNKEKEMILEMLKEGKITVDEAESLLESVGESRKRPEDRRVNKISSSVEKAVKKAGDAISNIDLDFDFDRSNLTPSTLTMSKNGVINQDQTKVEDDISSIEIDLSNGKIHLEKNEDDFILLDQSVYFKDKTDACDDYIQTTIDGDKLIISNNPNYDNRHADVSATIDLKLNKESYDKLEIDLTNGVISIEDVDFEKKDLNGVNCKMELVNTSGDTNVDNSNSKISIQSCKGNVDIDSVNGSVNLTNTVADLVKIDSVNGNIRLDGLAAGDLSVENNSGNIKIGHIKDGGSYKLVTRFGNITINLDDYDDDIKANIKSSAFSLSDRFTSLKKERGACLASTNPEKADLDIEASTGFGKVTVK